MSKKSFNKIESIENVSDVVSFVEEIAQTVESTVESTVENVVNTVEVAVTQITDAVTEVYAETFNSEEMIVDGVLKIVFDSEDNLWRIYKNIGNSWCSMAGFDERKYAIEWIEENKSFII